MKADIEYHIRLARPDEVGRLREIEDEAGERFDGLDIFDPSLSSSFSLDEMYRLAKLGQVWAACDRNDRPVGMVVASIRCGNGYIEELDVLAQHGRKGLGARLIEQVSKWALEQGCEYVDLSTFRDVPWNGPFYRNNGFRDLTPGEWTEDMPRIREAETRQGLVPEARVFMRRDLRNFAK
jgi:GNAT superfamily N-acetyltransferase